MKLIKNCHTCEHFNKYIFEKPCKFCEYDFTNNDENNSFNKWEKRE